jgi:hypothetical protein
MSKERLEKLNVAAFTLHMLLGTGIAAWAGTAYKSDNAVSTRLFSTLPVTHVDPDTAVSTTKIIVQKNQDQQNWVPIMLILAFVFWTACFHLLYFLLSRTSTYYSTMIQKGNNWVRWIEYGCSATIMLGLIFYVTSETQFDVVLLSLICFPTLMIFGNVVERCITAGDTTNAVLVTVGAWIVFAGIWAVLSRNFVAMYRHNKMIPTFVPAVFASMLVFYAAFGLIQLVQLCRPTNYEHIEFAYVVLSFVAKATLALLIASGLAGRNSVKRDVVTPQ